ncbi:MAG: hypothetical protein HOQ15_14340, partial [Gemmatimonadaceae bacterium]|nr:hypothetical protein [Gemmatimonadaceae bacterium]
MPDRNTPIHPPSRPVFLDPGGTRWRRIRGLALGLGVLSTILAVVLIVGVLVPPVLPDVGRGLRTPGAIGSAPRFALSRSARERLAARRRLFV